MAGRPALPTSIHEARGTARPDRTNEAEPKPAALQVGAKPPTWLKGVRRQRAWTELVELLQGQKLLTVMDAAALGMLVDAYGDYLEASDLIAGVACGHCGLPLSSKVPCPAVDVAPPVGAGHSPGRRYYTTRTKEGSLMIRPHPAMAVREGAWKRVAVMLGRFGMSPADRPKVSAAGEAESDPMAQLLEGVG